MDEDSTIAAYYGAINGSVRVSGLAVLQSRDREGLKDKKSWLLTLTEFQDTDNYANLESAITAAAPKTVYYADGVMIEGEINRVVAALNLTGSSVEGISKSKFNANVDDIIIMLKKASGVYPNHVESLVHALKAAHFLFSLYKDEDFTDSVEIVAGALDKFVRLDASAIRALNLFPDAREISAIPLENNDDFGVISGGSTKGANPVVRGISSVFSLLSHGCRTASGKKVLTDWLLQPLRSVEDILVRQEIVSAFVTHPSLARTWKDSVNLPDLSSIRIRLSKRTASLMDLLRVYAYANALPPIVSNLDEQLLSLGNSDSVWLKLFQSGYLSTLRRHSEEFRKYTEMIEELVEDPTAVDRPRIARSWNEALAELGSELDELEETVVKIWKSFTSSVDFGDEVKCERDKVRGYVFKTKKANEPRLRSLPTVTINQVLKDGIYFQTTKLRDAASSLQDIESKYENAQAAVVGEAVAVARTYVPVLEGAARTIGEIDALYGMAVAAGLSPQAYVRPRFNGLSDDDVRAKQSNLQPLLDHALASSIIQTSAVDGSSGRKLRITAARHPVIELLEDVNFVANNYGLDQEGGEGLLTIVSGPNMGGKSTYIRTLGVIALMAQIGAYVPAESAELPIFDAICSRVGASDRASKGLSTFMAEMLEASSILATATDRSLVIIDELGRGTSTYDGFGLAWAIAEWLCTHNKCMTLFATHYHELAALEDALPSLVRNKHVTTKTSSVSDSSSVSTSTVEDEAQSSEGILMLYEVKKGVSSASFGIHVAELASFPSSVVARAREKALQLEATSGYILARHRAAVIHSSDVGNVSKADLDFEAIGRKVMDLSADPTFMALDDGAKRRRLIETLDI